MDVVNYIIGYPNLKIIQNHVNFKFSLDTVLLANFVTLNKKAKKILDIGTGNAPIPIILSLKTNASITGVEIQKESYDLAVKSIELNNLTNKINLINENIINYCLNQESDYYDVIVCNPPFFKLNEGSKLNKTNEKTIARHEQNLNLESLFKVAKKLLKNNGNIAIVQRPERLIEIIEIMKKNNIEPKKIQFVYPKPDKPANILLIEGTKNGKSNVTILPPLYVYNEKNEYTTEILKFFS